MAEKTEVPHETRDDDRMPSTTRRTFLAAFAGAGAAVSLGSRMSWANGEIGFWAKDLPDEKLVEMFSTKTEHVMSLF